MNRPPPGATRTDTLFPHPSLCRSGRRDLVMRILHRDAHRLERLDRLPAEVLRGVERRQVEVRALVERHRLRGRLEEEELHDRKSTRLNPVTNAHLVCRPPLEIKTRDLKKTTHTYSKLSSNTI